MAYLNTVLSSIAALSDQIPTRIPGWLEEARARADEGGWLGWRYVPPAYAPLSPASLARALTSRESATEVESEVVRLLARRYRARRVHLTASGTGALTLALRTAFARADSRRVALPAFTCYSVGTAAAGADADVAVYDLEPTTLSPDLESLRRALMDGARTVVVAHLFGYPTDMAEVTALARQHGAVVVEDAAQAGGGTLRGDRLGTFAPLSVLSFGRGKGLTCGGGGALLVRSDEMEDHLPEEARRSVQEGRFGSGEMAGALAQWALGRPLLYGLPAKLPFLHLGETRYHRPPDPEPMARSAVRLLGEVLQEEGATEVAIRRLRSRELRRRLGSVPGVAPILPIPGSEPGALRFPFLLAGDGGDGCPALGITRAYPRPLSQVDVFRFRVRRPWRALPGAETLARKLYTAPTHSLVNEEDMRRMEAWVRSRADAGTAPGGSPGPDRSGERTRPPSPMSTGARLKHA